MPLVINGMQRSFTFKKGSETITLSDINASDSPKR